MSRSLRPGDAFGPYQVVRMLGRGAMGEVALVQHVQLGALYALKVMGQALADDPGARERFQREMAALAAVDAHPGVVRVHGSGWLPDGRPYFVMEYVEGQTLARALRHDMAQEHALEVVIEIAEALGFLHAHGIVHRDVKPENVLIAAEGRARLSDFGLVKATGDDPRRLTLTGEMIGTPAYMSPEQARGGVDLCPASDVYACGVVLYEVLAGRPPYSGQTSLEVCMQAAEAKPFPAPSSLRAGVDPRVEAVCLRALAPTPAERYPDGAALAEALREALAAPAPRSTRSALAVGAGLVLLAAGGVAALALRSGTPAAAEAPPPPALLRAEEHAARGDWPAVWAARDQAASWTGPAQARWEAVAAQARAALIAVAAEEGRFADAAALWDAGPPLADPRAAWALAAAGRPADAPLSAVEAPAERAWLAAWAGDWTACAEALDALEPAERAALGWELWSRGLPEAPAPFEGEAAAARWVGGVAALARGELGLAADGLAAGEGEPALARRTRARARLAWAWGDPLPLTHALEEALRHAPSGVAALIAWGEARELAPFLEPRARDSLLRQLPQELQDLRQPWPLDPGARWRAAHARARAGDPGAAREALVAAGADPVLAARSLALAELDACRRGRAGIPGLRLARAADALAALDAGPSRGPLVEEVRAAVAALPEADAPGPARALVQARLDRIRGQSLDAEALDAASPGDPAALREAALVADAACGYALVGDAREARGFLTAAERWAAVEAAAASEDEARDARLRRLEAQVHAREAGAPDAPSWEALAAELLPELGQLPLGELAAARKAFADGLAEDDWPRVEAKAAELLELALGVGPDQRRALYLRATLGDSTAARVYLAVVGDAPALALLRLRAAEVQADPRPLIALARQLAEGLPLPYANLVAAVSALDAHDDDGGLIDLARAVDRAPEEALTALALVADERLGRPDLQVELDAIAASRASSRVRAIARALLWLWQDTPRALAQGDAWSPRAAAELGPPLAAAPAHAGLRTLRALALLQHDGSAPAARLGLEAARHDLELASAALPWALGPRTALLRLTGERDLAAERVDRLGSMGWTWSSEAFPIPHALPAWRELPELEPWDGGSVNRAAAEAGTLRRPRTLGELMLLQREFTWWYREEPEAGRQQVWGQFQRLLGEASDPTLAERERAAYFSLHARRADDRDQRRAETREGLRMACALPWRPRTLALLAGLPGASPRLRALRQRVRPQVHDLWAQALSLAAGWDLAHHRAEAWDDVQDLHDAEFLDATQLRDPWSCTRDVLETLHDGYAPHVQHRQRTLARSSSREWALGLLRQGAFSRGQRGEVDVYFALSEDLRRERSPTRWRRAASVAGYLARTTDAVTFGGLRSDLLLGYVSRVRHAREERDRDRDRDREEEADPDDEVLQRLEDEALDLALALDPDAVDEDCESEARAWYRRARAAALRGDAEQLAAALARLDAAEERWGLDDALESDPRRRTLREHPTLGRLFEDR